jgi:hypothetical protein
MTKEMWEFVTGWMVCDGRSLDTHDPEFESLFHAIRFAWGGDIEKHYFNIPDLQGYFLRGLEPREHRDPWSDDSPVDPDGDIRKPLNRVSGNHGRRVGSIQTYSTALPVGGRYSDPDYEMVYTSPDVAVYYRNRSLRTAEDSELYGRGAHGHQLDFELTATRDPGGHQSNTVAHPARAGQPIKETGFAPPGHSQDSGAHQHTISPHAGDNETRPRNAYVYWIVRYKEEESA